MPLSLRRSLARVPVGRLLFELTLVFVAVSAALFANAWWQDRQAARAADAALDAFAIEMRSNRAQIEPLLEHHRQMAANAAGLLRELAGPSPPTLGPHELRARLTSGKGIGAASLSRAAWDSAIAAGITADIAFVTLRQVADVYAVQRRLDDLLDRFLSSVTSPGYFAADRRAETLTAFFVTSEILCEFEVAQLAAYDRVLSALAR